MKTDRYFILNKPFNMVSQFVSTHDVRLLGSLDFSFPEGTHAIGRLDKESEGLLLLTTDKKVTSLLFHGIKPHSRTYLVQVKNIVKPETVNQLSEGISISSKSGTRFLTSPCEVKLVQNPTHLDEPEICLHKNVPYSWLEIRLTEGRYHQIRKMVAAVNHKCLRLIRTQIEGLDLNGINPGEVKEVSRDFFYEKLNL